MTIKQLGGVFGRNPSFNEVEIGDGAIKLYRDASNNAVIEDFAAGYLKLIGAGSIQLFSNTGEILAKFVANGQNEFYYNNLSRFKTTVGGVEVTDGDLKFANGHGIDFSATAGTGTSELFDDYEEGVFTPEVADASTGGNQASGGTFSGRYTKIGNRVFCQISLINIATVGMTATNSIFIRGLPFTAYSGSNMYSPATILKSAITSTEGTLVGLVNVNTTTMSINNDVSGIAGATAALVSQISSGGGDIYTSFFYETAL